MTYKIGFHTGPAGNPTGIGDYFKQLDAARIPACVKSADHYGPCFELANIARASGVGHGIIFRLSTRGQDDGFSYDVPRYDLDAKSAAYLHWRATATKLPSEFDKGLVWVEVINEVDKARSDWLGYFAYELSILAKSEGYKTTHFGWSGGEPEYDDWQTPGMRKFLQYAAQNKDYVSVALHEYSYTTAHLLDDVPYYMVGRFQQLFDACAEMGIGRPKVFITEFGWEHRSVPSSGDAIPMLKEAADLYARFDDVEFATIWYLGGGFGDIHNQTQSLIAPVTEQALNYSPPIGGDPEPPPPNSGTFESAIWQESLSHQTISLMPEAALQKAIFFDGFVPVGSEYRQTYDGIEYACQVAENLGYNERRVYLAVVGQWNEVFYVNSETEPTPPTPPTPPPAPPPPEGDEYDLSLYFEPNERYGAIYEIKDPDGAQRRVQHQLHNDKLYITKGTGGIDGKAEYEVLYVDNHYIWRGLDTSPGKLNGRARFYDQRETGYTMARWCKRFMKVGETFIGSGHHVQFRYKDNCELSDLNSGSATNVTTLFAHYDWLDFNGIRINDVVKLGKSDGESFWFAKGIGMVGWKSGWNQSFLSELHGPGQRPNNEMEVIPCL